jgi:hypothetical protein
MMIEPDEHREDWEDGVREAYRLPLAGEEAARQRVLDRLRCEPASRISRPGGWWFDTGVVRVSPLGAAAAGLVALALGVWGGVWWGTRHHDAGLITAGSPPAETAAPAASTSAPAIVTFAFRAPAANRVYLVGDFNGWDPNATPLRRAATGAVWTVELPLPRGLHAYAFIVDGADWSVDPAAPLAPEMTFGRRNALLVVD